MKTLSLFVVTGANGCERVFEMRQARLMNMQKLGASELEAKAFRALTDHIDDIAFFRLLLDGWNYTPLKIRAWVAEFRPQGLKAWDRFTRTGFAMVSSRHSGFNCLLPSPSRQELKALSKKHDLGEYATNAFLVATYEVLRFAEAVNGIGVISTRKLSVSRDDDDYD